MATGRQQCHARRVLPKDPAADEITIRTVSDEPELRSAFAYIAPLFVTSVDSEQDFRLARLLERLPTDQDLMLVAVDADGQLHGAALGYRESGAVKLSALAVDPHLRRRGIGTRLMAELEVRARGAGATSIFLGAEDPALPFYRALGYQGRRRLLTKSLAGAALAAPPQLRRQRLAALRASRARRQALGQPDHDPTSASASVIAERSSECKVGIDPS